MQLVLGFTIPLLLVKHVVAARVAREAFGAESGYAYVIWGMHENPWTYVLQTSLLVVAWTHGAMGIHYWLRFRPWYPTVARPLGIIALVLPILALCGFLQAVREVNRLDADPRWHRAFTANAATVGERGVTELARLEIDLFLILAGLTIALMALRFTRRLVERRHGIIQVVFPGGVVATTHPGPTILEISRGERLPHASVCGGRARCSTCRVRIGQGAEHLPPAAANELRVLSRIGAAHNVRLACQIRPTQDIEVTPLFPVPPDMEEVRHQADYHQGREMEIAVMFADLRGFTTASEHRLPYDTVFLLNRYFKEMGGAIQDAGGVIDKYIGDGIMALFGLEDDIVRGTTNALRAAQEMSRRLRILNKELEHDLKEPLKIGIGIHTGGAIVGDMGWGAARSLTAIGDTVNTASRIEGLTKDFGCELLVSAAAAHVIGGGFEGHERIEVDVRGRNTKIEVIVVPDARDMKIVDPLG
jgi:adenylate cyclase